MYRTLRYLIFDNERRHVVVDGIEICEQASAKLAELIEADPEAEGSLIILGTLNPSRTAGESH